MQDLLLKAASLCKEAATLLREEETPEKQASEITDTMISKGLLPETERERYTNYFTANPEKIATTRDTIAPLPALSDAIGEVGSMDKHSYAKDPWDAFIAG